MGLDGLIDGKPGGPAGGGIGATLDVTGEKFNAGEQAANAAHVVVAIAFDPVANAFEDQCLLLKWFERREAFLEFGQFAFLLRPEVLGNDAIGAEDNDHALLALSLVGEAETGQVENVWQRGGAQAQGGTVSDMAVYVAPSTPGSYHVVATSKADASKSATAQVTVGTQ